MGEGVLLGACTLSATIKSSSWFPKASKHSNLSLRKVYYLLPFEWFYRLGGRGFVKLMPKKATYVWWCGGWLAWNSAGIMLLHWRVWLFIFWVFFIVGVAVEFPLCFPTRPFSTSTICKHWLQSNVSVEITSFPKLLLIKTKPPKRRQIENDRTNSPKIKPNTGAQLQPTYYPFCLVRFRFLLVCATQGVN